MKNETIYHAPVGTVVNCYTDTAPFPQPPILGVTLITDMFYARPEVYRYGFYFFRISPVQVSMGDIPKNGTWFSVLHDRVEIAYVGIDSQHLRPWSRALWDEYCITMSPDTSKGAIV